MQIWSRFPDCCSCSQGTKCYQYIASVRVKHCATSLCGTGSHQDQWQHERAQPATSSRAIVLTAADTAVSISALFPSNGKRLHECPLVWAFSRKSAGLQTERKKYPRLRT